MYDIGSGMLPGSGTPSINLHDLVRTLFPINRSITGMGVRETLAILGRHIPLAVEEVASGTPILDWEVPLEWNIRGATISTLGGRRVVDFATSNLHVVGYSRAVHEVVSRQELARHVHTLPEQPDLTPYRTGYFANDWGFCMPHNCWLMMRDESYRIDIDSDIGPGYLTYGELFLPGETAEEILITAHICHPSLANDNLSGLAVGTALAIRQAQRKRRLGCRFLFIPATVGAIAWLARNEPILDRIRHGLVLTCLGDPGPFHYKQSRQGTAAIDRVVAHVLRRRHVPHKIMGFSPYGYDERQYCSPGYDLPVGCFMRSPNGSFSEYHTSADNLEFVTAEALQESLEVVMDVIGVLEQNVIFERVDGRGEPQLGRRGLYRAISGQKDHAAAQMALLWLLNQADGRHSLLDIADRSGVPFEHLALAAEAASKADLIRRATPGT